MERQGGEKRKGGREKREEGWMTIYYHYIYPNYYWMAMSLFTLFSFTTTTTTTMTTTTTTHLP